MSETAIRKRELLNEPYSKIRERDTLSKPIPEDLFLDHRTGDIHTDFVGGPGYNAEMRWETMSGAGYLTPTDRFFVRNHAPTPRLQAGSWVLQVGGDAAGEPCSLTLEELRAMPAVTITKALECAGNGRKSFREHQGWTPPGTDWRLGAIGVAEWTGTPLRLVLERAGVRPDATSVMAESLDEARMRRPLPIGKAMDDALVVWEMNGEELPADHGFPARLIVPGWAAVASVKWLGHIEVSREPLSSPWNTEKYVMSGESYGGEPVTAQSPKSALELPWPARLSRGRHVIRGRSWSPDSSVSLVEYSLDGGQDWSGAEIEGPNLPGAWATWSFVWETSPGDYRVMVRATDDRGRSQPDDVPPNDLGYLYDGVVGHPVEVA